MIATVSLAAYIAWTKFGSSFQTISNSRERASRDVVHAVNRRAAGLEYPPSTGTLPPTISVEYLPKKDRTEMELTLASLQAGTPSGSPRNVTLRMKSEFQGKARAADHGEASVIVTVTCESTSSGLLAMGSKLPVCALKNAVISARALRNVDESYHSHRKDQVTHETAKFKLETPDLIQIAGADHAELTVGRVTITLTQAHLADIREFVARMKPGLDALGARE